jgi:uncharacterized protein YqjF (DUF2071 family)
VHRKGRDPGVWFFSLDAMSRLACSAARRFFHLPYHFARMSVADDNDQLAYRCERSSSVQSLVRAKVCEVRMAGQPGSLDFFLIERYLLYTELGGGLFTGRVHHQPYPLRNAQLLEMSDGLVASNRLVPRAIEHVVFSPGVDVKIYPLKG